jgi:hypothetical protein
LCGVWLCGDVDLWAATQQSHHVEPTCRSAGGTEESPAKIKEATAGSGWAWLCQQLVAVQIPATIRAGDTIQWRDVAGVDNLGNIISSADYTLTYWLRTNTANEGASVVGTAYGTGWQFSIAANVSNGFDAGTWYWQAIANKTGSIITLGAGQLQVLPVLSYAATPGAFDGRTQAQIDLDAVQAAIRAIVSGGAKQYSIGSRSFTKIDLSELMERESRLKAEVKREQMASLIANGQGNPHNLFVRF